MRGGSGIRRRGALHRKRETSKVCDISYGRIDPDQCYETGTQKARLKSVIGRSAVSVNAIAFHQSTDTLLQVAGSSVIVSSTASLDKLEGHLISSSKQTLSCVAVTSCGKYAATGETGHNPCVKIWQLRDDQGNFIGRLLRALPAVHTVSISIVKFTPDDSTLISIGCQHDSQIITWDWKTGQDIGVGKLMSAVNALTISYDSSICVTVGQKSVKYWFLPLASDGVNKRSGLTSRSAILADKRNVNFVDATFCDASNRLMAVTASGEILEFNGNKKYVKCYSWKEGGEFKAVCISRVPEGLLVGCSDGLVRLFCLIGDDLDFLADLASPTHLFADPSMVYDAQQLQTHPDDAIFAEPRCIVSSPNGSSFVVGYSDRSLIEYARENKAWSFKRASLGHVGSVNSVEVFPSTSPCLPPGTVITSGSDGTIRFWNFESQNEQKKEMSNILCPSLLKVLYLEENPEVLIDKRSLEAAGPPVEETHSSEASGVLCSRVSHDGRMMVAGTSAGMLYMIDLSFSDMPILDVINAHDNDVTCLDFSDHATTSSSSHDHHPVFLASGGRDRFAHVFRRVPYSSQYVHCAVLDAHQSALKSVRFASNSGQLQLFTSASDRTVIVWRFDSSTSTDEKCNFTRFQQISTASSISDLQFIRYLDLIVIAGHDRLLRQFDLNGKLVRDVKGTDDDVAQHGKIVKIGIDNSGSYVCSVCSDKFVYITDLRSGNCMAVLCGFGAPPTDAVFSDDFKSVYVTTSNGAIFIWRLAKNLTERMISSQVRLMEEITMRTSTPDSLLGSGSETISDSSSFNRPLGAPEFSGSSTSLCSVDDDYSTQFSSVRGSDRAKRSIYPQPPTSLNWHPIGNSSYARVGDSSFSPLVQTAPPVERRTHTNIFQSPDLYETDASETQSDFISSSSRRRNRIFSDEEEQDNSGNSGSQYLQAGGTSDVRRSASPSLYSQNDDLRGYQSSKSMMNLRDVVGAPQRVPTAKELMMSHIAAQRTSQSGSSSNITSGRMKWGDLAPVSSSHNDWQPSSTTSEVYNNNNHNNNPMIQQHTTGYKTPTRDHYVPTYQMGSDAVHPPSLAPRTSSRTPLTTPPSQQALQQIQNNSPFRRKSVDRNSLSRKFLDNGGAQPKTVWSPQNVVTRRSNSNLFAAVANEPPSHQPTISRRHTEKQQKLRFTTAPVQTRQISIDHHDSNDHSDEFSDGDHVSSTTFASRPISRYRRVVRPNTVTVDSRDAEIARRKTRKADDLSVPFSTSLRSRSQSPNKLALSQMLGSRDVIPSSPTSTGGSGSSGSRFTQQKRRDSDMSYVRSATRGRDEMRKSTDALNKLMAVRSKLHQSSENLRKSTENLALLKNLDDQSGSGTVSHRTRSISNLRNAENAGNMESFGTFDVESRLRSGSTNSLAQSRMLARSVGNVNDSIAMEGSMGSNRDYDSPSRRLANTINMIKKASNPDLTAPEQFEDTGSPFAMKMRGAVQKKMDRYKQRNKSGVAGRNQTSEESDSNNSDVISSSINRRALVAGSRSTASSDYSQSSSTLTGGGGFTARRFYDSPRAMAVNSAPRRTSGNYMVTKMSEQSMEGPDLGSDDSPRSSVNSHEWQNLIEKSHDGTKNPIICHVQDCMEQLRIHVDKSIQAKKMVEDDSSLPIEQKKIVMCEIDRSIERVIEKLAPNSSQTSISKPDLTNGNRTVQNLQNQSAGNDYTPMKGANIYGILKENLTSRQ